MANPNIQIDDLVREMTESEYQSYQAEKKALDSALAETQAKLQARESALAKLKALGLTEAEIAAL
jgi:DNA-binding NarL/FixJ family response regulator